MSVSILLKRTLSGQEIYIPVASQYEYKDYLQPYATKNSLELVASMDVGFDIDQNILINLIRELEFVVEKVSFDSDIDKETADYFQNRVSEIIEPLKNEVSNEKVRGFVC